MVDSGTGSPIPTPWIIHPMIILIGLLKVFTFRKVVGLSRMIRVSSTQ